MLDGGGIDTRGCDLNAGELSTPRLSLVLSRKGSVRTRLEFTLLATVVIFTIAYLILLFSLLPGNERKEDFSVYYLCALELRADVDPYTTSMKPLERRLGFETHSIDKGTHPPTFLLIFELFTALTPAAAYWIWTALNVAALFASLMLLLGGSGMGRKAVLIFVAGAMWYAPTQLHFWFSQANFLILLLLVAMMRLLKRRNDAAAGLMLALAGLLRVFPFAMGAYLLLAGKWRAFIFASIGTLAGVAVTIPLVGWANCVSFVHGVSYMTGQEWIATTRNVAPSAFLSRLFWRAAGLHLSPALDALRHLAIVLFELLILALNVRATMRSEHTDSDALFSLWVVTALMLSPMVFLHYLVLLLVPFAQLASGWSCGRPNWRAINLALVSIVLADVAFAAYPINAAAHGLLKSMLEECGFAALAAAYLSAYAAAVGGVGVNRASVVRIASARSTNPRQLEVAHGA